MQLRYFPFLILLLLVFAIDTAQAVGAFTPAVHFSSQPNWLVTCKKYDQKIPQSQVENGFFYQLLEEQFNVEQQADYRHNIREIVSEAGIQNGSEISVDFDPSYERIDFHKLIVWRDGKPLDRLKTASFKMIADEKELSKFIYQGSYSAYLILSDIRKGDKIEYAYTITGRNPIFGNKFFKDIYFDSGQAVAHQFKALLISPQRKLYFKPFNKVPATSAYNYKGLKCYAWENFQVKPLPDYDNAPGWYNPYGYIQVTEYRTWKEVTDWALGINPVPTHLTGKLAERVARMKAETGTDKEKFFRKATMMVQDEVRYMGIEMGEYSHKANRPEKVYDQRYGDCKDKAMLLASVLKAGGIEAHMVLVNADMKDHIDQFLPTPNAFDHAAVVANVNGKPVWVDATIAYQRGTGTNLFFPDYARGLILKPGTASLAVIAPTKTGRVIISETYIVPEKKGPVQLEVKSTYTLNQAEDMRDKIASESRAGMEKNYLNYYAKTYPGLKSADSLVIKDNEQTNELTTIERYRISNFLKKDSTGYSYSGLLYAGMIADQLPGIADNIHNPITLNYPNDIDHTIRVILPAGWTAEDQHSEIKRDAYAFASRYTTSGDTLTLNYKFKWLKDFLPVNKFSEYRDDVQRLTDKGLSYGFTYTPDGDVPPFSINWLLVYFVIAICVIAAIVALKIYRTETPDILFTSGAYFTPLGGWLIIVAIAMAATPISVLVTMINADMFDLAKWNQHLYSAHGGYRAMFLFEAGGNALLLCFAAFCFVLLINRRDILPKAITWFYIYAVAFAIADFILADQLTHGRVSTGATYAIIRSVIAAAIWIPYFQRSERVEQTFIVPFPAHNFTFEVAEAEAVMVE